MVTDHENLLSLSLLFFLLVHWQEVLDLQTRLEIKRTDMLNRQPETKQDMIWYGQIQVLHVSASDELHKCRVGSFWLGGYFAGKANFIFRKCASEKVLLEWRVWS